MATNTSTGAPVPTLGDAPNVPADMLKLAVFMDPVTIPRFTSTALASIAFPSPYNGQQVNVSGQIYIWKSSAWVPVNETKRGRTDIQIESNGYARIVSSACFFSGSVPPASITANGINNSFIPFWDGTVDGSGALLKVGGKGGVFTTYYTSGDTVAFYWTAVR